MGDRPTHPTALDRIDDEAAAPDDRDEDERLLERRAALLAELKAVDAEIAARTDDPLVEVTRRHPG